uniref:Uncharacterized protein n=1 Tax=Micrurus carvalhoi TaxID=3147026 RepID=A0A2H6NF89_9SAUR
MALNSGEKSLDILLFRSLCKIRHLLRRRCSGRYYPLYEIIEAPPVGLAKKQSSVYNVWMISLPTHHSLFKYMKQLIIDFFHGGIGQVTCLRAHQLLIDTSRPIRDWLVP